ncbi:MAG TPA: MBL fold metallo-hydrolase [Steroidobacteraceae bacterium]|nr:MBL fold metallo-hydrolase [Steroidobacteraceae bacterium]
MYRRQFLAGAARTMFAAAVCGGTALRGRAADKPSLRSTPLAERLWLIEGAGGNVTVFQNGGGVLLVDGGAQAHTTQLLAEVRRLTGTDRVHTLFNTHWHHDQTGSNEVLGKAGTRIIAHENTRLWLTTDVDSTWEGRVYQPLPKIAQPSQTFYTDGTLQFGGEHIEYGYLPQAHTDGDIYVFFRGADVLVAADVAAAGAFPIIDYVTNGWIGGMATGVQTLAELAGEHTRVIAGRGAPLTRAQLDVEYNMLNTLKQRLSKLLAQGMSAQEMIDARPAREFEAAWGNPALLIRNSYPGLANRARELGVAIV